MFSQKNLIKPAACINTASETDMNSFHKTNT